MLLLLSVVCCAAPYANVVWGPGDADNTFPVVMPHEVDMAKAAAKVTCTHWSLMRVVSACMLASHGNGAACHMQHLL